MLLPLFMEAQNIQEITTSELKEIIIKERSITFFTPKYNNKWKKAALKHLQAIEDMELGYATNLVVYMDLTDKNRIKQEHHILTIYSSDIGFYGSVYIIQDDVNANYFKQNFNIKGMENKIPITLVNDMNSVKTYTGIDGDLDDYLNRIKIN